MKRQFFLWLILLAIQSNAQDELPNFKVVSNAKNKAIISWKNPFGESCKQISVQRSYDSLKSFRSIFSSLSPTLPENGYLDNDYLTGIKNYYRIFYVLDDGRYFFTKSASPVMTNEVIKAIKDEKVKIAKDEKIFNQNFDLFKNIELSLINFKAKAIDKLKADEERKMFLDSLKQHLIDSIANLPKVKFYSIYRRNSKRPVLVLNEESFTCFKDSISLNTKDTIVEKDDEKVLWLNYIIPAWKPSKFIFTNNKGYVELHLTDFAINKYKVIFYDFKNNEIFRIKQIKYEKLILEKSNFLQAGWFYFELYNNEKIVEKNKFLIESDIY